jgi:HAD superfamily hydrolase (TIGR01509 family)
MQGMSSVEWSAYIHDRLGVDLDAGRISDLVVGHVLDRYEHDLPLLPGALDAVRRTAARWRLGLASSSPPEVIRTVLDRAGLAGCFAATASSDEVPRGKPAPDVYLLAAARLGADPAASVAVEDSSNGLRSAAAAGFRVVAVPRPSYPPDADALAHAALVLDDLEGLTPEALESLPREP